MNPQRILRASMQSILGGDNWEAIAEEGEASRFFIAWHNKRYTGPWSPVWTTESAENLFHLEPLTGLLYLCYFFCPIFLGTGTAILEVFMPLVQSVRSLIATPVCTSFFKSSDHFARLDSLSILLSSQGRDSRVPYTPMFPMLPDQCYV